MSGTATSGLQAGHSALVLMLPETATQQIAGWRARFDPYHLTIPSHITVMYPPFIRRTDWVDERRTLAPLLADVPAFGITLARTGAFLAPRGVLWLEPEDRGMVRQLEARLRQHLGLPPSPPPYVFTPHVTLGFFDAESALRRAQAEIEATLTPVIFRATRASYLVYQADRTWQLVDELPFAEVAL